MPKAMEQRVRLEELLVKCLLVLRAASRNNKLAPSEVDTDQGSTNLKEIVRGLTHSEGIVRVFAVAEGEEALTEEQRAMSSDEHELVSGCIFPATASGGVENFKIEVVRSLLGRNLL